MKRIWCLLGIAMVVAAQSPAILPLCEGGAPPPPCTEWPPKFPKDGKPHNAKLGGGSGSVTIRPSGRIRFEAIAGISTTITLLSDRPWIDDPKNYGGVSMIIRSSELTPIVFCNIRIQRCWLLEGK